LRFRLGLLHGTAAGNEVHDERDHCEQQEQMDEQASALEHHKPTEPQHNQNYCEDKKHWMTLLSSIKVSRALTCEQLLFSESRRVACALLGRFGITRGGGLRIYALSSGVSTSGGKGDTMLILLVVLLLLAFCAFPSWPYSRNWGYYPSGGLGLIVVIILIVALVNHGF
jgi:hypothetical protein